MADLLENIALRLEDITFAGISKIKVQPRPSIPDNVENWQVFFSDDQDILRFLQCESRFGDKEMDFNTYALIMENKLFLEKKSCS